MPVTFLPYPTIDFNARAKILGVTLPTDLVGWSNWLVSAENVYGKSKDIPWLTDYQIRKVQMLGTYICFFIYPWSFNVYATNLWKKIGFMSAKLVSMLRWKYEFLDYDIDLYVYNLVRRYAKIG